MRALLIVLAFALLMVPCLCQSQQVGGDFGKSWIENYGNKNVVKEAPAGLWTFGGIPKGNVLSNGKLIQLGPAELIFPAFPETTTPIIMNATTPQNMIGANASEINPMYLNQDPWFIAQTTGAPVLFRQLAY